MSTKQVKVYAYETQSIAWFGTGGVGRVMSIQVVGPGTTWSAAILTVVGRVHPNCPPVALLGVKPITASLPYAMQFDIAGYSDIGLQVTTVNGSSVELDAYAVLGG